MTPELRMRPYQRDCHAAIVKEFEVRRSTLAVLPTGCGKTIVFGFLIKLYIETGRAMVLAHREELLSQACGKIHQVTGQMPEVERAESWADMAVWSDWRSRVIVSSVQTQNSGRQGRGRMTRFNPDEFSLLVVDEAHHSTAASYRKAIAHYQQNQQLKLLGVTATPDRHDEAALGQVFESCAFEYQISDAIHDGWLVPIQQRAVMVDDLDFSEVRANANDLNGEDLRRVLEFEKVLHGIANPTFELSDGRKTLVFAHSVAQAERMAEILNRREADCAKVVTGSTPSDERRLLFRDYAERKFRFLVNVGVASEGFDDPGIEVVAIGRPTKSRALYAQMIGRGTRPLAGLVDGIDDDDQQGQLGYEGQQRVADIRKKRIGESAKPNLEVFDFVGNSTRHKLISVCDVLGGQYSDEVIEMADKIARATGKPVDAMQRLKEAAEKIRAERERQARRRSFIVAKAKYQTKAIDPFDVLQIDAPRQPGYIKDEPLTPGQAGLLEKFKVPTEGLSKWKASKLITEVLDRARNKLCTFGQANFLGRYRYDTSKITVRQASKLIDAIKANGYHRPHDEITAAILAASAADPPRQRTTAPVAAASTWTSDDERPPLTDDGSRGWELLPW